MPGIQSGVQRVPTFDLGKLQGPRRLFVYTYITRTRAYEFTYVLDIRDGNHRCAPGSTLTCSCTGPLVNSWSAPARLPGNRPSSLPPLFVTPFVKPRNEVEDWLNHPLTFRRLALIRASLISLSYLFFSSSSSSSVVARDPRCASPWQISVCLIELDVPRDTTFTIGDRLSFGNNKIKRAWFCIAAKKLSKDGYDVSSAEHTTWTGNHERIIKGR